MNEQSVLFLSLCIGALVGFLHVFLQKKFIASKNNRSYLAGLTIRYGILFMATLTILKILHVDYTFYSLGFALTIITNMIYTLRNELWI